MLDNSPHFNLDHRTDQSVLVDGGGLTSLSLELGGLIDDVDQEPHAHRHRTFV